jgi:excisionase family DNA binding protein
VGNGAFLALPFGIALAAPYLDLMSPIELPAVMTVNEAASILNLTAETVCSYIRRGELAASGLGTNRRGEPCAPYAIQGEDLLQLLGTRRIASTVPRADLSAGSPGRRTRSRRRSRVLVSARERGQ